MRQSMIIENDNGKREHFICPARDCEISLDDINKPIPRFFSHKHARNNGWACTGNIKFCQPGYDFVYVCSKCYKSLNKEIG